MAPQDTMTATIRPLPAPRPAPAALDAARAAVKRIAPLWPLDSFVAVNPFLGLGGQSLPEAAGLLGRVAGARLTMPRAFYLERVADGRITPADLAFGLGEQRGAGLPATPEALLVAARVEASPFVLLPTLAHWASRESGRDWAGFAAERVSAFCAGWFDTGQAHWPTARAGEGLYAAWRADAMIDRSPEIAGLKGFRNAVAALPLSAEALIAWAGETLDLDEAGLELLFHRLLATTEGWAGLARRSLWEAELDGRTDNTPLELLAVRLGWDMALLQLFAERPGFLPDWRRAWAAAAGSGPADRDGAIDAALHAAYETAERRALFDKLSTAVPPARPQSPPAVQAAFCIDVRSEVFRRALESVAPSVETIGFAGFFGFAFEYVPLGETQGRAQCPVLLKPSLLICEGIDRLDPNAQAELGHAARLGRRAAAAWAGFKGAAVSSFAFVETAGLAFAGKLLRDGLLPSRRPLAAADLFRENLGPRLQPEPLGSRLAGLEPGVRLDIAEAVLGAMGLRTGFARIVLLAGHGSTTANNPHASGLDCGACGGHSGEPNARLAARVLNDRLVRRGLAARGIEIPPETHFLPARHDTTTDHVEIFDEDSLPLTHRADLDRLREHLAAAARLTRAERAGQLPLDASRPVDPQVFARAANWAETRPEWGLAGCRAFIAAPRARTAGLDLDGRVFLHSYDWTADTSFKTLELILTAPVVVASWINLQYYGSTVDNAAFGSGNKVLHNVVGRIGVLEGQGGNLRTGLPWQSVHDGERLVHEPVRLSVLVEAPEDAIAAVLARHDGLRQLVENGWVSLFSLDHEGRVAGRYAGGGWHLAESRDLARAA